LREPQAAVFWENSLGAFFYDLEAMLYRSAVKGL
jgi:hypothetical protein